MGDAIISLLMIYFDMKNCRKVCEVNNCKKKHKHMHDTKKKKKQSKCKDSKFGTLVAFEQQWSTAKWFIQSVEFFELYHPLLFFNQKKKKELGSRFLVSFIQ
ncbi:hypothetical protein RFI_04969 [Reticulomyxa filosa]|uniref:Uncharacterized protein n=1 Tax=Reticulomyxa filosa TaxID=46433 RepID=X6P0Q8_RETFI|nr:hypothetical protein RFI_04969 [Reticulomyxa filosa]|eukprot:ETO32150.1 hypothetical protein RFI_04969 [Reticulomyxa filosa]